MEKQLMNRVIISIGSNQGDREENIQKSIELIQKKIGKINKQSELIETEPEDMESQDLFLNSCIEISSNLDPFQLLQELKKIEFELGRPTKSKGKRLNRTIDLDVIFYNDLILESDELTIPHKSYSKRSFVLMPLMQLNPNLKDPKTKICIKQLLK